MTNVFCMLAGYTIHTVVALAHAGLIPLEHQQTVQQAFQQCAPLLSTTPDTLTALMDKSLPTMIGLGGNSNSLPTLSPALPFDTSVNGQMARCSSYPWLDPAFGDPCPIGSFPIHPMGSLWVVLPILGLMLQYGTLLARQLSHCTHSLCWTVCWLFFWCPIS